MRNPLAMDNTNVDSNIPKEIYGARPYILAFSAAWVSLSTARCLKYLTI